MSGRPAARLRPIIVTILACALVAATVGAVMNRQLISDHIAAAGFEAPSPVLELQQSLHLTDDGTRIFLASHPTLDGSQHFNTQCAELLQGVTAHVLGCYVDDRIHLFNVVDPRVAGIVQVTAAHELLHAAYARMRPGDRSVLAEKLRKLYKERSQADPDLAKRMEMYSNLSDTAFAGELHSILGSEMEDLPEWLEEHYAQWFEDRSSITATYRAYQGVFQGLKNDSNSLRERMRVLRVDVEKRKADYDIAIEAYDADAAELEQQLNAPKRSKSRATIESEREKQRDLEERRTELKETLKGLQDDIDHYNEQRAALQQLGELSTELEQQLDSALAPVTTRPTE
ncbi:putative nucleic acid-binding Zn-ribbon protein [Leucobacter exalbidus]|uniref:Nucleic acid-binding Zn-ribbon protein n=1 Tax=Leucobacter exalbidus TaxID=662960 RepID=A0A940SZW3_9MICO|nr:hypothetical protein [Leucobacter exalbidus]MBP1325305.1 putative nucleic acid-binding Zn-ribbon protein [Leucobacter exalbidus]